MTRLRNLPFGLGLLALLWGCSASEPSPNIVWISIDTLRADHLGCYGSARDTSPHIDEVARDGVLFEDTWSTSSWTLPAHISMLTGLPISAHCGCGENLTEPTPHPGHYLRGRFLSEDLASAGWDTAGFYSFRYLDPEFGFGRGFETWKFVPRTFRSDPELFAKYKAIRDSDDVEAGKALVAQYPDEFDVHKVWAGETVDHGLAWIDQKHTESKSPFFLFMHIFDVHDPYLPPPPHDKQFDPDYQGKLDGTNLSTGTSPMRLDMDPRDLQHLIALYDGGIAAVDAQIGRLVDGLRARGIDGNTILVITSDHGDEFFEHGRKLHRKALYRETVQVPLILRWPVGLPAGRRVPGVASLTDLVPTLRAACKLPADPRLPGLNLLDCVRAGQMPEGREVLSELSYRRTDESGWLVSLVDNDRHTIVSATGTPAVSAVCFDRKLDPLERQPATPIPWDSPKGRQLSTRLDALRTQLRSLRDEFAPMRVDTRPMSEAVNERVRELGYSGTPILPTLDSARDMPLCMDGCIWAR